MKNPELYGKRNDDILKALEGQQPENVPVILMIGNGQIEYGGMTMKQALNSAPADAAVAYTKLFDDMWTDGFVSLPNKVLQKAYEVLKGVQMCLGPDDTTSQHVTVEHMSEDEYPQLIEDPTRFVKDVLLPRKYPEWFASDKETALRIFKTILGDMGYTYAVFNAEIAKRMVLEYSQVQVSDDTKMAYNPMDEMLFDFRSFKGILTDLRRRPDMVKNACDALWAIRKNPTPKAENVLPMYQWYTLIPTYLNPKQFEKFYWPYMKELVEDIAASGSKSSILMEGNWDGIIDFFLDLPKHSCMMHIDESDLARTKKIIGTHHAIAGGVKITDLKSCSLETCKDKVKEIIDVCAPGGGFLYTNGKSLVSPSDVTKNLIETFNYAHELSKY